MHAGHRALFTARLAAQCPCRKAEARIANHQGQLHLPAKERKRNTASYERHGFLSLPTHMEQSPFIGLQRLTLSYILLCVCCLPFWPFSLIMCLLQKSATSRPKSDAMLLSDSSLNELDGSMWLKTWEL